MTRSWPHRKEKPGTHLSLRWMGTHKPIRLRKQKPSKKKRPTPRWQLPVSNACFDEVTSDIESRLRSVEGRERDETWIDSDVPRLAAIERRLEELERRLRIPPQVLGFAAAEASSPQNSKKQK